MLLINLHTRLCSKGRLNRQIAYMKEIVHNNPDSEYARFILFLLRKKFWLGGRNITYQFLLNYAWNSFVTTKYDAIIEIDKLKFRNDDTLMSIYTDIFLSEDFDQFPFSSKNYSMEKKVLSMLNTEGPYENNYVKIKKDDIIVDAGANMGLFSLFAYSKGAKKIFAFEPQNEAIQLLRENINSNNCAGIIEIVPLGLSEKVETLELKRPKGAHAAASLILKYQGPNESQVIECTDLDKWVLKNKIPHIDFIKADIEGAERNMIKGATKVLQNFEPRLAICIYHLKDDFEVIKGLILNANPKYVINRTSHKLFAYVP